MSETEGIGKQHKDQQEKKRKYKFKLFKNNNSKAVGKALLRRENWENVCINILIKLIILV